MNELFFCPRSSQMTLGDHNLQSNLSSSHYHDKCADGVPKTHLTVITVGRCSALMILTTWWQTKFKMPPLSATCWRCSQVIDSKQAKMHWRCKEGEGAKFDGTKSYRLWQRARGSDKPQENIRWPGAKRDRPLQPSRYTSHFLRQDAELNTIKFSSCASFLYWLCFVSSNSPS